MFGSAILDIAIALVFVYLLLSLIVTAVNELIETIIKLRAAHLAKAIEKLLGDDTAKSFFAHVLIGGLSPNSWFVKRPRKPSYISAAAFAETILDLLKPANTTATRTFTDIQSAINNLPNGDLKTSLTILLNSAHEDLTTFKTNLENWFNNQMDRVTGWYKRKIQLITIGVAAALTVGMNADSIVIANALSNDAALRASLVAQAQEMAKQPLASKEQDEQKKNEDLTKQIAQQVAALDERIKKTQGLGLPIGWAKTPDRWPMTILGWLLTTMAISLGAPFWFDLLNKFISIRSAGKAPEPKPAAGPVL